jgi:hypothetical protein
MPKTNGHCEIQMKGAPRMPPQAMLLVGGLQL